MLHSGMVLAAPQSGSGKTTITCALLAAMKNRKLAVRAFKSGPDYIDPMFHRQVIGVPSRNLDTFFSGADQIRELYGYDRESFSYSVIEGAMGLYDGLGGTQKEGSAYHLAQTLDLPVVLVLDARGMGRTMVALLAGMLQYDRDHRIIGVILNRTSEGFCRTMTPVIEKELGLPVLGCFPVQKSLHLESRHLGLKMPQEMEGLRKQVNQASEKLEETADLDRMLQLLQSWALLHAFRDGKRNCLNYRNREKTKGFYRKRKNGRRNVRLSQLQKMRHFVFIMRITCGFWKRMVENSSGFHRLDRKKFQRKRMRFFWEEAIRNFVPGSSRKMSPCAILFGRQLKMVCRPWQSAAGLCICMNP